MTTPTSTCTHTPGLASAPNSSKIVTPVTKPSLSTGAAIQGKENGTHMQKSVSSSSTERVLTDITEFLNHPILSATPKSRAKKSNGPCVLTSSEVIAMMEAKEEQKKEEQEAKELRKKEHEEKKQQREQEKIRKAEEKLKREAERKRRAEEREIEKKQKTEQREAEKKRKAELRQKQGAEREKCIRSVKQQASVTESGIQSAKISSNECAACLGAYEDDVIDGVLGKEWIQCTNSYACGKWMHYSCLSTDENGLYICPTCQITFS